MAITHTCADKRAGEGTSIPFAPLVARFILVATFYASRISGFVGNAAPPKSPSNLHADRPSVAREIPRSSITNQRARGTPGGVGWGCGMGYGMGVGSVGWG